MANKKLSQEELQRVVNIQERRQAVIGELGSIELEKIRLESRRNNALKFQDTTETEEQALAKLLEEKYGKGSIDIDKGEFIPVTAPAPQLKKRTGKKAE